MQEKTNDAIIKIAIWQPLSAAICLADAGKRNNFGVMRECSFTAVEAGVVKSGKTRSGKDWQSLEKIGKKWQIFRILISVTASFTQC